VPWWIEWILGAFGGGFATEVLALIRSREGPLWSEIKRLNAKIDALEVAAVALRHERNTLTFLRQSLEYEANELLEELGRPHKYGVAPKGE
jgi:hypothetical protein